MSKTSMTAIALGAFGAALLASAASAAPLNATTIGSAEVSNVDQIGLVCNEYYGRCWRTRGPRYVLRYYYDPSYFPGRGYNYYAGPRLLNDDVAVCRQRAGNPRRNFRCWHFSDFTACLRNVCRWGKSGSVIASPDFRV
jgi:hypothetical protein